MAKTYAEHLEKCIKFANKTFKNFKAKLTQTNDVQIIDWRNKNDSCTYYIRFLFDKTAQTLTVSGDVGYGVFHFSEPATFEAVSKYSTLNYFISKVDIIDLFLNKCILSKCNINSLESKFPLCSRSSGQDSVFNLIIFLLNNIPKENNLYSEIIQKLSKYHKIGFWKTKALKNWELETSEINKQKYIGLKNLSSTCYMNSILHYQVLAI